MVKKITQYTELKKILPRDMEDKRKYKKKSLKEVKEELEKLNEFAEFSNDSLVDRRLLFEVDSEDLLVKLIEKDTGEVLKEIHLEEILDKKSGVSKSLGMLIDERI